METQKDFENKVTEFIHRLPLMSGNIGELLDAANVQQMNDEELLAFVKQDTRAFVPTFCTWPTPSASEPKGMMIL